MSDWGRDAARPGNPPRCENSAFSGCGMLGRHLAQTGAGQQAPWGFHRRNKAGSLVINWTPTMGGGDLMDFDLSTLGKLHIVLDSIVIV